MPSECNNNMRRAPLRQRRSYSLLSGQPFGHDAGPAHVGRLADGAEPATSLGVSLEARSAAAAATAGRQRAAERDENFVWSKVL